MSNDSLFDLIRDNARSKSMLNKKTTEANKWFFSLRKELKPVNRHRLLKDDKLISKQSRYNKTILGRMVMFFYDPKHYKTLPYYDTFPLVIPIGKGSVRGSFLGLNLHYIHPIARAKFLDSLMDLINDKSLSENAKLKITYDKLKNASKYRYFAPALKMYLNKHVDSQIVTIAPEDWRIAVFLPTEQFNKASSTKVWSNSKKNR